MAVFTPARSVTDVTGLPTDVRDTLAQLFEEAAAAARERRPEDAAALVGSARTVTENKMPDGPLADRLVHGCDLVERTAPGEPLVAAEYCRAMRDRVEAAD
jgi:hypothetical protein